MTVLPRHIVYWVLAGAALALLAFEAPTSRVLSPPREHGKAEKGQSARGRPIFVWTGGGYQGGK